MEERPVKILVADDEPAIVGLLKDYFELSGYLVLTAKNGTEALEKAGQSPDVILLDINMPELDGMQVCTKIRDFVTCPILFLTARVEDADKVKGFAVGGDDYIVKPFSLEELGARVKAHLRREARAQHRGEVRFTGDLTVDYAGRAVFFRGADLGLAKKEFEILELLSLNPGQVFGKERIYEKIWGFDSEGDAAVIAEHIRRIRAKLAEVTDKAYIETVWGVGYRWNG